MKTIILPALIAAFLISGCSSAYKASHTPDDVYYSPAPPDKEGSQDRYESYTSNSEDNYLRMKVRNRYQFGIVDDYSYWNDSRYDFGYVCSPSREVLLNPYNPYFGLAYGSYYTPWGSWYSPYSSFYSPYSTIVYYTNPKVNYGTTGKTNLNSYRNSYYNNTNNKNTLGSLLNKAFSNNNSTYNLNNNTPSRTFNSGVTPSSSAGGRSGGFNSSGSSSGSSRPPRGGN